LSRGVGTTGIERKHEERGITVLYLITGIGSLVLAVRLAMVAWTLQHTGRGSGEVIRGLITWGVIIFVIGVAMVGLGGLASDWKGRGFGAWIGGGSTVVVLGASWVLQGYGQTWEGSQREVAVGASIGAGITAVAGVVLIFVGYFG